LACAFAVTFVPLPTTQASTLAGLQPLADEAPSLPLTSKFEKVADGEGGPYVLKLKNTSNSALKVSAKVLLSVSFHAESKARNIPEHVIDAGQVWTIPELAANDKVIINAKNYVPLELTVP
jgi:hypothetical protein